MPFRANVLELDIPRQLSETGTPFSQFGLRFSDSAAQSG
jgi:hypothetical protein